MSEQAIGEVVAPTEQVEQPTYSATEQKALDMGWRPQTEWQGEADDFVSAKEFVQRKSFFDKISQQSKELKELKTTIGEYTKHHKNIEEYTRKQVLQELKLKKKEALEQGDADAVIDIDDAIADFKIKERDLQEQEAKVKEESNKPDPAQLHAWQEKNGWYNSSKPMTVYANQLAAEYIAQNGRNNPSAVLAYVEKEVRKEFPDKFKNQNRERPSSVEGSSAGKATKTDKYSLSPEELKVANRFVRNGIYENVDAYAKELAKLNKQEGK